MVDRASTSLQVSSLEGRVIRARFGRQSHGHEHAPLESFPQELLRGLQQGRGVLFVGPGVARGAGLQVRERLREAMCNGLRQQVSAREAAGLEAFLARSTSAEVAQALHDMLGGEAFVRFLQGRLSFPDLPPPPLYYALRALPFHTLLTTNLDRLLERTFENPLDGELEAKVVIPTPQTEEPIPDAGDRAVLVKLFGDFDHVDQLILTVDHYQTYFRLRPQLVTRLRALLEVGPALFVGFQPQDIEFQRLYAQVGALLSRAHRRACAIVEGVDRFEVNWWSQRALVLVNANSFGGIEGTLRELSMQLQRQSHPGGDIEPDVSAPGARGSVNSAWALVGVLQRQLEQASQRALLAGPGGHLELRSGYIPVGVIPESGAGQNREARLPSLLVENTPEAVLRLQAPEAADIHRTLEEESRVLVHGPSGGGKTTLLLHLLQTRLDACREGGMRELVVYLPLTQVAAAPQLSLMECVIEHLQSLGGKEARELIETAVMDALIEGRALLLLDGLDEVPAQRQAGVLERLEVLLNDSQRARVVVTCRSGALEPEVLPSSLGFKLFELAPLSQEQQGAFIRDRLHGNPSVAQVLAALFRSGVAPWAERLATNPLHLLLFCLKYLEEGRLADSRLTLYSAYMGSLLRRASAPDGNAFYAYDKELILQAIAQHVQEHPEELLTEELLNDLAEQEMGRTHISPRREPERRLEARDLVREIIAHSGILVGPDLHKSYVFRHEALREYLVARRLMDPTRDDARACIDAHASDPSWVGVWRLTAAMANDATPLLERLEADPANRKRLARSFGEAQRVQPAFLSRRLGAQGADREVGRLLVRLQGQLSPKDMLELFGEILWKDNELFIQEGRRSDARSLFVALSSLDRMVEDEWDLAHGAATVLAGWRGQGESTPDAPWPCALVEVPSGLFLMGDTLRGNYRYLEVPGFLIGRDPVTMGQYQQFNPSHTLDTLSDAEAFNESDQPVVLVNWYQAWVCARWFSCRLPQEMEWEKAAAWDPEQQVRRAYPWGNEWQAARSNTLEGRMGGQGHTSSVFRYAITGLSAYGCADMAGNVFEWTQDRGQGLPERRVLKGGSWQASAAFAQTMAAIWLKPSYSGPEVGFRLCRSLGGDG